MGTNLLSFIGVAALIIMIPGADMALVARNTLANGRLSGLKTVAGAGFGLSVHAGAAVAGLSAVIATSARAFEAVKLVGAGFLIFMGIQTLMASRQSPTGANESVSGPKRQVSRNPTLEGFLTNVLNPKLAIFFLSLLPQFVSSPSNATSETLLLSAVFIAMGGAWLSFYVFAIDSMSGFLNRPTIQNRINRVVGVVLIGLGARLALFRPN